VPCLLVVLEAATSPWAEAFAHYHWSEPVSESIIRFDGKPGEFRADALVADLAVRITPILPLHANSPRFCI
jgi:hypothetical protein